MPGSVADRFSLAGRVAIVSGSGTGIGRAIALVFAEQGADIVLAARRREPLEHTAADVESMGRRALVVPTDVTDPEQCEEARRRDGRRVRPARRGREQRRRRADQGTHGLGSRRVATDRRREPGRRLLPVARRRPADARRAARVRSSTSRRGPASTRFRSAFRTARRRRPSTTSRTHWRLRGPHTGCGSMRWRLVVC
jgi:hypothetical protein